MMREALLCVCTEQGGHGREHRGAPGSSSHGRSMLTACPLELAIRINTLGMDLHSPVTDRIMRTNLQKMSIPLEKWHSEEREREPGQTRTGRPGCLSCDQSRLGKSHRVQRCGVSCEFHERAKRAPTWEFDDLAKSSTLQALVY